jgi:FMN reductase
VTTRTIAVVSAGLGQPSSTRLLADQLAAATARGLPGGTQIITIELRELAHDIIDNLLTGFPSPTRSQPAAPADPYASVPSFEQLLHSR